MSDFFNKCLVKLWPFSHLVLTNFIVARPAPHKESSVAPPVVSVVVPTRDEAGNIEEIFRCTPEMSGGTEVIFVERNLKDKTYEAIEHAIKRHTERNAKLYRQTGDCKGDTVRLGYKMATGDIFINLDADMVVLPDDLSRFYEAIVCGHGDFINGVHLVNPMVKQAMRFFNILGNKFFSMAFTWLSGQPIKDTLCGIKILSRKNYEALARNRSCFGDFDLLLWAAKRSRPVLSVN